MIKQLQRPSLDFESWFPFHGKTRILFFFWFTAMSFVPIAIWLFGVQSTQLTMQLATMIQAALTTVILSQAWSNRRIGATLVGVVFMGWAIEWIGSTTGFPFGVYEYTDRLQPQIAHVPLLVPAAWFMMLPITWAVSERIVGTTKGWRFILVAALAMTAWDLYLDPQMVNWGFWIWEPVSGSTYFGIPWMNYFGWILGSAIMTTVARPSSMKPISTQFMVLYTLTWFFEFGGLAIFWGLPGPGLVGALGMGIFVALGWWQPFQSETGPGTE